MAWYASELDALSAWDVRQPIPASTLAPVLSAPPFIPIPSLVNARDIGAVPGSAIAPNRIYRCGVLDAAGRDPQATIWLGNCVTRVFDLRRADERQTARDPSVLGVKNVWRETEGEELKLSVAEFAQGAGVPAWARQLMSVVHTYKPIFREVLEHVRDRPTEPFLFHCTAGRDRTGVLAGLLHHLAGSAADVAMRDYMLSRIGTEPARERLLGLVMASLGLDDAAAPGFTDMVSLRPAFWNAFLAELSTQYGGWDGYVTQGLGFSEADLARIKRNLRS